MSWSRTGWVSPDILHTFLNFTYIDTSHTSDLDLFQVPADPKAALYIRPTLIGCCFYNLTSFSLAWFQFIPPSPQCELHASLSACVPGSDNPLFCLGTTDPYFEGTEACFGVRPSSSALFFILLSPVCLTFVIFKISSSNIIMIRIIIVIMTGGGLLGN